MNSTSKTRRNNVAVTAIAGAAGVALLAGGVTFALWQDTETVPGADFTAGTLDLAQAGPQAWSDISADVAANPATIDLASFLIVPGDTIAGTQGLTVELTGDNIEASLAVDFTGGPLLTGALASATSGVSGTVYLYDGVVAAADLGAATPPTPLASADLLTASGSGATVLFENGVDTPTDAVTKRVLTAVVVLNFDETTPEQVRTSAVAELAGIEFVLNQTRDNL